MSMAEIKEEVAVMSEREQKELFAYMIALRDANDKALTRRLTEKIDLANMEVMRRGDSGS